MNISTDRRVGDATSLIKHGMIRCSGHIVGAVDTHRKYRDMRMDDLDPASELSRQTPAMIPLKSRSSNFRTFSSPSIPSKLPNDIEGDRKTRMPMGRDEQNHMHRKVDS